MSRAAFALILLAIVALAWACADGPTDHQAAIDSAAALREAQGDAKRQSQFMATVRRVCGSDNAAWTELPGGAIQCATKHGRKTQVAEVRP